MVGYIGLPVAFIAWGHPDPRYHDSVIMMNTDNQKYLLQLKYCSVSFEDNTAKWTFYIFCESSQLYS
jgi:hypothetical protein